MADEDIAFYEAMMAEEEADQFEDEMEALRELEGLPAEPRKPPIQGPTITKKLSESMKTPPSSGKENVENIPPKRNSENTDEPIVIGFQNSNEPTEPSEPFPNEVCHEEIGQKRKPDVLTGSTENPPKKSRPAKTIVLRNPPIECDSVRIVSDDGTVRFLRKKAKIEDNTSSEENMQMIGISMRELRLQAFKEKEEVETRRMEALQMSQKKSKEAHSKNLDWISKYRAQKYTDLLSDETTNRAILKWLKMWQTCVFKVKRKPKKNTDGKMQESFGRKYGGSGGTNNKPKWKSYAQKLEENATLDDEEDTPYFRPKFRVLMLSGPPGLGKTTLAHVAASHSGYRPTEINASSDRAGDDFKNTVSQALTNQNATDKRPNCLILDEIDGIHKPSVDFLIKVINATKPTKEEKKKKKALTLGPLVRPIICICNDPYVPALRELREHSLILYFNGIDRTRLTHRLEDVCKLNHVKVDRSALTKLATKTEDDIRSCINALQFLSMNNNNKSVTAADIDKVNMGKDQQRSLQYSLKELLAIGSQKSIRDRFKKSIEIGRCFGEFKKLASSMFEVLDQIKPTSLESIAQSRDWYCWSDRIDHYIGKSQNYQLYPVQEYLLPALHLLLAQNGSIFDNFKIPKSSYENYKKEKDNLNLLTMWRDAVEIHTKVNFSAKEMIRQIPVLLKICEPNMRSVNPALWSSREHEAIRHCVNVMVDLGLKMQLVKNRETMQSDFEIEPPIFHISTFPTESTVKQFTLSNSTKTLLSAEIDREKIRRKEAHFASMTESRNLKAQPSISPAMRAVIMPPKPKAPNPKDLLRKKKKSVFGKFTKIERPVSENKKLERAQIEKEKIDPGIGNSAIFYKFNQGYSNAVRQVIKIREII